MKTSHGVAWSAVSASRWFAWPFFLVMAGVVLTMPQPVGARQARSPAAACFPLESLSSPLRARAEQLLLSALDGEALYTIASDIKPMSSGILSIDVAIDAVDRREADDLEQILRTWTCGGEVSGGLHAFEAVYNGKRPMDVMVFNHPRMTQVVTARPALFVPLGAVASSSPLDVVKAVDRADRGARYRGYGFLFGYPDDAVEFFAVADQRQQAGGDFVERDFVSLPTFRGERHFVYAVPKGAERTEADRALAARVQTVYDDYLERRARHIRDNTGAGVTALLREWFDDGTGDVRPSHGWRRRVEAAGVAR